MDPTPPPSPALAPVPQRKGLHPVAWVGLGCGGLTLLALVVAGAVAFWGFRKAKDFVAELNENPQKVAAEYFVRAHPDLEEVSQDPESGRMTIRNREGLTATLDYGDIAQGRIMWVDAEGNRVTLGGGDPSRIPSWVPQPDGLDDLIVPFQTESGSQVSGMYTATSRLRSAEVESEFKDALESHEILYSGRSAVALGDHERVTINHSGGGRKVSLHLVGQEGEKLVVQVTYEGTP